MTLSTAIAHVVVTGFLTVSCFKRAVVDNTAQVLSKTEKASAGLTVYSVCLSTITLVLATDKAAQRILTNKTKHMPAAPKDIDANPNPPSANDTTSVTPQPVEPYHWQPYPTPSLSRLIESTETISAPISTCTPNDNTTAETYHLQPSPTPSLSCLIESTETMSAPITCSNTSLLLCPMITTLLPTSSQTMARKPTECESFDDESTVREDDCSEPQPRKEHALEPTLNILIAKMTALILDDPPRPSKL
ncbi:hypothetical protein EV702DRAFT_1282063 [Suillus placidus]|uniref:Uncharacterized protein n=1 Tax=Suillus placidus TaxID=48579 RepID=A0A9P6ZKI1_9AGAM|nr:hypothetical protein EV702DRAFT_1282063 [Suillus placidus]